MKHTVKNMISKKLIDKRILELGHSIDNYYQDRNNKIILVGLLRGAFIFIADLCRVISISHEIDFMIVSSYRNNISSTHDVQILKDLDEDILGKDVLIVEDIIDSGYTLNYILNILKLRQPKSISICTLLDKPHHRKVDVLINWVGFTISDEFVIGYGIDYAQRYRHLPYIGRILLQ